MTITIPDSLKEGTHYVRADIHYGIYCVSKYIAKFKFSQLEYRLKLISTSSGMRPEQITRVEIGEV